MADDDTPFLARWSRRKADVRAGRPVVAEAPVAAQVAPPPAGQDPGLAAAPAPADMTPPPAPEPPPTLDDVERLDARRDDFTRFVRPTTAPEVKNAALKKLFHTDPHFNVMDGLDVYIDDYNKPDPLPASMLRRMAQSQFLGLFTDDGEHPKPSPPAAPTTVARSAEPATEPAATHDEDPDLRLQPDDAAGRAGPEPGAREDAGRER
jgi:hypothetical protein